MATFPGGIASFAGFVALHTLSVDNHASQHNSEQAEIIAAQQKVGTGASTPTSNMVLRGTGVGASAWGQVNQATDITGITPVANGGTGQNNLSGLTLPGAILTLSPVITTPVIASFTNAQHNHSNAAGGGKITSAGITSFDTSLTTISNPYKFRASRIAAANTGNGAFAVVAFDTEQYDTNNNLSAGVYTAPVNGFWHFNAGINTTTSGAEVTIVSLFVNGVEYTRGNQIITTSQIVGVNVSDTIQLSAGDTVDARAYNSAARPLSVGDPSQNFFSGFLVSQT